MTAHGAALESAARRTALRRTLVPGWAVLACILVAAHAPAAVRAPVVIALLCIVPGTALVGLLNVTFALELALAIALSVALSGLTAGVLVYANLWSPTAVVLIVAAISLAGGLRDIGLAGRPRRAVPQIVPLLLAILTGVRRGLGRDLPGAVAASAALVRRREVRPRIGVALAAVGELLRPAGHRLRGVARVRPPHVAARRPRRKRAAAPTVPDSSLQSFLLEELRRHTGSRSRHRRRPPRSLDHLEPHELADVLSWSSLQRFVAHRAVQKVNPELWFVDDLERLLPRQPLVSHGTRDAPAPPRMPRGVWITAVSERMSVPVAWRLLEEDAKPKEWRVPLALAAIDTLPVLGLGAVIAAGTAHGSLSGFRGGLEARGLPYLLRVDAVTAARELAPSRPSRSAAEAREVLQRRLADRAAVPVGGQPDGAQAHAELVLVQGVERLVLCEVSTSGRANAFWLSNLAAGTSLERLAFLVGLVERQRVERATTHDFLLGPLRAHADGGGDLQHRLAAVALAQGLSTVDLSAAPAEGAAEA